MQNVIQKYYSGFIREEDLLDALEEAVSDWHENAYNDMSLHVFLGMCIPEYELWMKEPNKFLAQMHQQSYHPRFWDLID